MHFSQIIAIASGAAMVAAAPARPIQVGVDDVVLYGRGRYQIMKRSDLDELNQLRQNGTVPPKPCYLDDGFHGPEGQATKRSAPLNKRKGTTLIIPNPHQRFLGWDILVSQVTKGAPTSITVSTGHEVSNSISVGTSATFTLVKDFLESSLEISYENSWTTTQSQEFLAEVPAGKYGAFVSNPWTNRESGNVFEGTIGTEGTLSYYQADSYETKKYAQMDWVDGVIALCTGDEFPLKRCLGEGTL